MNWNEYPKVKPPQMEGTYLVTVRECEGVPRFVTEMQYNPGSGWWDEVSEQIGFDWNGLVVAWATMPEPYGG